MHVNRGLLGWGVFFIVLGVVPLAVRSGAIDESVVLRAWELWPLILIGIGLGLLLQRTKAAVVGSLVVAVTAGLMAGGALAVGINGIGDIGSGFSACNVGNTGTAFPDQRATFGTDARYQVELDCGSLSADTAAGSDWALVGVSPEGRPPEVTLRTDGVDVRTPTRTGTTIGIASAAGVDWKMTLPRDPRTRLELKLNAGSADLGLGGLAITQLDVAVNAGSAAVNLADAVSVGRVTADVNAGSISIAFPAVNTTADLSANAGSIEFCVPRDVDLRIRVEDNTLGSNNFGSRGLVQQGDTWQSPDFGSGAATIEVTTSANLGSIDLNPENGCAN